MDLLAILRARCEALPTGDHTLGLKAVVQHVESAEKHLARGRDSVDDTAFTDVIYRTNQAFEGAMKEAYRVLSGKTPSRTAVADIENFLTSGNVLRPLVLAQLRTYRKDWRNESTHDYRLAFDEDEALLAIASVCVFAIVLVDQITEKLHFYAAKAHAHPAPGGRSGQSLADRIADALQNFRFDYDSRRGARFREAEVLGALAGYLSASFPELQVSVGAPLTQGGREEVDVLVRGENRQVVIELKLGRVTAARLDMAILQIQRYMSLARISEGIVFGYGEVGEPLRKSLSLREYGQVIVLSVPAPTPPA